MVKIQFCGLLNQFFLGESLVFSVFLFLLNTLLCLPIKFNPAFVLVKPKRLLADIGEILSKWYFFVGVFLHWFNHPFCWNHLQGLPPQVLCSGDPDLRLLADSKREAVRSHGMIEFYIWGWMTGWIVVTWLLFRLPLSCAIIVCKPSFCFTCIMFCATIPLLQRRKNGTRTATGRLQQWQATLPRWCSRRRNLMELIPQRWWQLLEFVLMSFDWDWFHGGRNSICSK